MLPAKTIDRQNCTGWSLVARGEGWLGGMLHVIDLQGRTVLQQQVESGSIDLQLDLSGQPTGHYNIELYPDQNSERVYYGKQVVVE